MIDVDYFKAFNDSFGHLAGDEALRQVAEAIRGSCSRPSDLPARYGGEEFALVLPNTSPGGARLVAEKLRQTVMALNIPTHARAGSSLTVSIGLATRRRRRQPLPAADLGGGQGAVPGQEQRP
jgi:two-component system chemotaxis family response regulator WspR